MPLNLKDWQKMLLLLGICLFMFSTAGRAEVVERIVAVVNDEVITMSEVDQMAKAMQGQPGVRLPRRQQGPAEGTPGSPH